MAYEGVNVTDAGTLAALKGVAGYGYGHGNFVGDGSAVNANVVAQRDLSLQTEISAGTERQFLNNQINRVQNDLSSQVERGHTTLSRQISDNRFDTRINEVIAGMTANDKAMLQIINANATASMQRDFDLSKQIAECCCKLESGQATIIANQESARANAAAAEAAALRVIVNNGIGNGNS